MYICCKCFKSFPNPSNLIRHYKYDHLFSGKSITVSCKQNGCNQIFSNFSTFRAHLDRLHKLQKKENIARNNYPEPPRTSNFDEMNNSTLPKNQEEAPDLVNSVTIGTETLIEDLKKNSLSLSLQLYANNNMSRKQALEIQGIIKKLLSMVSIAIKSTIQGKTIKDINNFQNVLHFCDDPFKEISSEHRLFKMLKEVKLFDYPLTFAIDNSISEKVISGIPTLAPKTTNIYIMPLVFQFKSIFELPNVLEQTLKNTDNYLSANNLQNFASGEIFKMKKQKYVNDLVIPYVLYADDFQINNALGSHCSSICGFYYNFPTMPQYLLSKLDLIFHCAFIDTCNIKKFGYDRSLYHLVNQLKQLEDGVDITTSKGSVKVRFILGVIVGDNLGMNSILGFVQSFNSKRFCRVCTRTRENTKTDVSELALFLRSKDSYMVDLSINNFKETGIKNSCIFDKLQSFDAYENFCFDIMHDVFEGVCRYDLSNIILALIGNNILSIDVLNSRKTFFQFGETEIGNVSPDIDITRLKLFNLKMTASEMMCFVHFLPLMIGDLIPRQNNSWKLLTYLIEIIDLLYQSEYSLNDLSRLQLLIEDHHALYIKLFGPTLKPKHHFLIHYVTAIKRCGPLKYLWAMRFEAKHKESKMYMHNITSRLNPSYSLAVKSSLKFSQFLIKHENGFQGDFDSSIDNNHFETKDLSKEEYYSKIVEIEKVNFKRIKMCETSVIYKGTEYKPNYYLARKFVDKFEFYKIKALMYDSSLLILCYLINIKKFDPHFQSYEVESISTNKLFIKDIHFFSSPPMHIYSINNGKTYIRNKFF